MEKNVPQKKKVIVIVGPTASGKSDAAVHIARAFGGEVVSADSRQVYRGLDIGTGKITKEEMRGIPHHLLDVADPRRVFSAADFRTLAEKAIEDIVSRGKTPVIAGGTGFYIDTLLSPAPLPDTKPNPLLRKRLKKKNAEQLFSELRALDPKRAKTIDRKNPRRLIRAIEIARHAGSMPEKRPTESRYDTLWIGIRLPDAELKEKIARRLHSRIHAGMLEEARTLHEKGLSWKRMDELGLEYRFLARYLQGEMTKEEMETELATAIWQYARRQKTYWRRNPRIRWFTPRDISDIEKEVKKFLCRGDRT